MSNMNSRDSLHHMAGYRHVHVVRQPSLMENSGQMKKLSDSGNLGSFFSPGLNLRKTNSIQRGNLSDIREEPSSVTYA